MSYHRDNQNNFSRTRTRSPNNQRFRNGSTNNSQTFQPRREFNTKLSPINQSNSNMTPFTKDFWEEGENLNGDKIRNDNQIQINSWANKQPIAPIDDFNKMQFPTCVYDTLTKNLKFDKPTSIQMQTWPCALKGQDVVSIAKTGSGKTLAFVLPAMAQISMNKNNIREGPRCLILAPTRELANQIYEEAIRFGKPWNIACTCCYGGVPKINQVRDLRNGVNVLIATPGRLIDLIKQGMCSLKEVTQFVLDEADRMLDMGFKPQIDEILSQLRPDRQTLMFSATWPKDVQSLAYNVFKQEPVQIMVGDNPEVSQNERITQEIKFVEENDKFNELQNILSQNKNSRILVFTETKKQVDLIASDLWNKGINCQGLHGDKAQPTRDSTLNKFKKENDCVLIATDVAQRGLDIKDVAIVINQDFPRQCEDYIHRIGRTARGEEKGRAIAFFNNSNDKISANLVNALESCKQHVPEWLYNMSKRHGQNTYNRRTRY